MGVFDKLKNALFEVEYVEVEDKPKKDIKKKQSIKKEIEKEEKPIAKKIVLPKKVDKVEQLEEVELIDEDFEVRPKEEKVVDNKSSFKLIEDNDFEVIDEPKIVKTFDIDKFPNDNLDNGYKKNDVVEINKIDNLNYGNNNNQTFDNVQKKVYSFEEKPLKKEVVQQTENKLYGVDNSYKVNVHEYGTYEKKEEKTYFKPSPIISPIYGILDKNYKKEDVVSKKEIRITSNYSRTNVDVDDIRNKAFGRRSSRTEAIKEENNSFDVDTESVDDSDDGNLLVDLTDDNDKPEIKKVTVGDAMEYFQDLGLEYNVDYVDASKGNDTTKQAVSSNVETKNDSLKSDKIESKDSVLIKNDSNSNDVDDDNLFDLIDSMYTDDK